jgi:hypothetical protein
MGLILPPPSDSEYSRPGPASPFQLYGLGLEDAGGRRVTVICLDATTQPGVM